MSKKTWVKVKRGLIDDPKHREAIGEAIWLYLHILDRTDYETGIAFDWKDASEAESLDLDVTTLRRQRRRLERAGYIRTEQKQHKQLIYVNNWTNPKTYSGDVLNQGRRQAPPSADSQGGHQGGRSGPPSTPQGGHQGGHQGGRSGPPSSIIISHVMNHEGTTARARMREDVEPGPEDALFDVIGEVCQLDLVHCSEDLIRKVWKTQSGLKSLEPDIEMADLVFQVREFGKWHVEIEWIGKTPHPLWILDNWRKFKSWKENRNGNGRDKLQERGPDSRENSLADRDRFVRKPKPAV